MNIKDVINNTPSNTMPKCYRPPRAGFKKVHKRKHLGTVGAELNFQSKGQI